MGSLHPPSWLRTALIQWFLRDPASLDSIPNHNHLHQPWFPFPQRLPSRQRPILFSPAASIPRRRQDHPSILQHQQLTSSGTCLSYCSEPFIMHQSTQHQQPSFSNINNLLPEVHKYRCTQTPTTTSILSSFGDIEVFNS